MKEIVERLHEQKQLELAKSILESEGYKVTKKSPGKLHESAGLKESTEGYSWSGMGWHGVPGDKHHTNEYYMDDDHKLGIVYAPDDTSMEDEEEEGYSAEIQDPEEDYDSIEFSPVFKTEEEAKSWVENWFRQNESKKLEEAYDEDNEENRSGFNTIFREFSKNDWYGSSELPDGTGPFIAHLEDTYILISGDEEERRGASVDIYIGDGDEGYYLSISPANKAKRIATKIATALNSGEDIDKIVQDYGFHSYY